jgi:hypothetical protein
MRLREAREAFVEGFLGAVRLYLAILVAPFAAAKAFLDQGSAADR